VIEEHKFAQLFDSINLPSCSTGVSLISFGGITGGGSGPAIAAGVIGPALWSKAIEQTIDIPKLFHK
jgi:hypothetical protein